uniref:Ribosomal protein L33 n=1 Tax=Romanomermis culicivorax TaxID=13658 RepID=A0A915JZL0_ROMCU
MTKRVSLCGRYEYKRTKTKAQSVKRLIVLLTHAKSINASCIKFGPHNKDKQPKNQNLGTR